MGGAPETAVGVIGLGIMGSAIAANLLKAGFSVVGTDIVAERCRELQASGGDAVASAGEVGRRCRRILLSVPSEAALAAVCSELCGSCASGTIVVETSTISLPVKEECRRALAAHGVILLDCTLSGTGAQAKTRDLAVYASGEADAIRAVRPILVALARTCHEVGAFGNGMKMKLVANLLVAIHNVAAAEAVLLGARLGLDPHLVVQVVGDGAGSSRMFQVRGPIMAERSWTVPAMKNSVWQKDLKLIQAALEACGCAAPLFFATVPVYRAALDWGHAEHDTAAVYEVLENMVPATHAHKEQSR